MILIVLFLPEGALMENTCFTSVGIFTWETFPETCIPPLFCSTLNPWFPVPWPLPCWLYSNCIDVDVKARSSTCISAATAFPVSSVTYPVISPSGSRKKSLMICWPHTSLPRCSAWPLKPDGVQNIVRSGPSTFVALPTLNSPSSISRLSNS